MEWLNYHHLLYFWTVAREGSIARAAEVLNLAQPTISTQIKQLEASLGEDLLARRGRGLELTASGEMVFAYADEIFSLGRELVGAVRLGMTDRPMRLNVGLVDAVPKTLASEMLRPALDLERPVHLVVREGKLQDLVADLVVHRLDILLSDSRVKGTDAPRVFHHELGHCGVQFLARPTLARKLRRKFPFSLDGAPAILPTENTALRQSLQSWFALHGIQPQVIADVEDGALIKDLAEGGHGFIAVPELVAATVRKRHGLSLVGAAEDCRETIWAISTERRLTHPAVQAVTEANRLRMRG
jgi:LysR family transcriptional activator of nhaA